MRPGRRTAVALLLAVLTLTAYEPVLQNDFVGYDDGEYILENVRVREGFSLSGLGWALTTDYAGNWHPLTWLSHMLDVDLFGLSPRGHHLVSVLIHAANAVLLFMVLARMTGAFWASAVVSALFAVHPLHVESVAWAAERKDLLAGFFWLASMGAYLGYLRRRGGMRYAAVLIFFAFGLMSKPTAVTLPFVLLLLDGWPLGRMGSPAGQKHDRLKPPGRRLPAGASRAILEKVPLAFLATASAVMTFMAQRSGGAVSTFENIPLQPRLFNALRSFLVYAWQTLYPLKLSFFYPYPASLPVWRAAAEAILLLGLSLICLGARRKFPYLAVGWFWYLVTLLPVSGIVQVGMQARADRYTYLPLIGLFLIAAWGAADAVRGRPRLAALIGAGAAALLLIFTQAARIQVGYWRDSFSLFRHGAEAVEGNWLAHNNLGNILSKQKRYGEAMAEYRKAIHAGPMYPDVHYNLGFLMEEMGRPEEAVGWYRQALAADPSYVDAHNNLGIILLGRGDVNEAVIHFREAFRLSPGNASFPYNLAMALMKRGDKDGAEYYYRRAVELNPDHLKARLNLGSLLLERGEAGAALEEFEEATRREPGDPRSRYHAAEALARLGRMKEAAAHYREALRLSPGFVEARQKLDALTGGGAGP